MDIIARVGTFGNEHYDTCHVTVKPHDLILSDHELTMYVGETYQMDAIIYPEEDLTISWSSKNRAVAAVSNGLVTAVAEGNTQIIARIRSGSQYVYDTCQVRVIDEETSLYTIRFLNYNGVELQSSQVLAGDMPAYTGATPTKPEDDNYTYTFSGWSPEIVAAAADADSAGKQHCSGLPGALPVLRNGRDRHPPLCPIRPGTLRCGAGDPTGLRAELVYCRGEGTDRRCPQQLAEI